MARYDQDAPGWLGGWHGFEADLATLGDLARSVDAEVTANIRPRTERLMTTYATGVTFGAKSPGGDVGVARQKYHDCLTATVAQLAAYVNAAGILTQAAHQVIDAYAGADALAVASSREVRLALTNATAAAAQLERDQASAAVAASEDRVQRHHTRLDD